MSPADRPPLSRRPPTDADNLILRFSGSTADDGILDLARYAQTIQGWDTYLRLAGNLYQNAVVDAQGQRLPTTLDIQIHAQRKGSYEVLLYFILGAAAGGIVGNRADALAVWTFRRLVRWYKDLLNTHRKTKGATTNIEHIVAALEALASQNHLTLHPSAPAHEPPKPDSTQDDEVELDPVSTDLNSKRLLVEKIDTSLKDATTLLAADCRLIEVISTKGVVVALDRADYDVLQRPLTLPLPEGLWHRGQAKFERINVKTGRALAYLAVEGHPSHSVDFVRIADPEIHTPPNVYTAAFDNDTALTVWARQVGAEKGRLNLMWELTVHPPVQPSLFDH